MSKILDLLLSSGLVEGRVLPSGEVEFRSGSDSTVLASGAGAGKMRMLCARLAVVFGGASQDPPVLYGGQLTHEIPIEDTTATAELEFQNLPGDTWFRLRRTA